jgi:SDR family mycofactocin-dependent oxidoreductase
VGELAGRTALITGAARGQGRCHAQRLAAAGADIIAVDICAQIASVPYAMSTADDLAETARLVQELDRRIVTVVADVRDEKALSVAVAEGSAELGSPEIVVANAGIWPISAEPGVDPFRDALEVNLIGTFNTVEAAIPAMVSAGRGGSIVLISSTAGLVGVGGSKRCPLGYAASKSGVVGLMRCYANNLAPHSIRVNVIAPTGVRTPMVLNDAMPDLVNADPTLKAAVVNALPVEMVEPEDISAAVEWLASERARYVTGTVLPVDAGNVNRR